MDEMSIERCTPGAIHVRILCIVTAWAFCGCASEREGADGNGDPAGEEAEGESEEEPSQDITGDPDPVEDPSCLEDMILCGGACVNLESDHANCGACSHPCAPAEVCSEGACLLECPDGESNCEGSCVDLMNDLSNCGGCGSVCTPDHATAGCGSGACSIVSCNDGWDDCDDRVNNGCETRLNTNQNCCCCLDRCETELGRYCDDFDCKP
jgi:hypothetical protein